MLLTKYLSFFVLRASTAGDSTVTTLAEVIPTIVAAALLELDEGNVIEPLITNIDFPGPGILHQTPFINRIVAEADDDLQSQTLEASASDETSPSAATVSVHGAYVRLKDLAQLGSIGDMAAVAGQLIGQCLVVRKDLDLATLFATLATDQGSTTSAAIAPADLYDAYGDLRAAYAPLPYHLVLHPSQIWNTNGLIVLLDNSSDALQSHGLGTVGEDFARSGFSGMIMGFNLWADGNIAMTTASGSGAAFSRAVMKNVRKRGLQIEIERDSTVVADKIVGTDIRGEALLRDKHGNEMQFPNFA